MTFRATANALCKAMPGAEWSEPFGPGHDVWKVGSKMFALMGSNDKGISVKCPDLETATMLKDAGVGTKAPYMHASWIQLPNTTTKDELKHRIAVSYDTIRSGLTKKAQSTLPTREEAI
jgi:predicted DNA-binding protein (MmcQ/YjbR family)